MKKRANRPVKPRRRKVPSARVNGPADVGDENLPAYSEGGVDLTLIRWFLSLTPAERLEVLRTSPHLLLGAKGRRKKPKAIDRLTQRAKRGVKT